MTARFGAAVPAPIRKRTDDADVQTYWLAGLRTVSALNAREHWSARHRRVKAERQAVALEVRALPTLGADQAARITLVRIAPRLLDGHDNLASALKAVADQITEQLGCANDRDRRLSFVYDQRRGRPREYAVQVTVAVERQP